MEWRVTQIRAFTLFQPKRKCHSQQSAETLRTHPTETQRKTTVVNSTVSGVSHKTTDNV